jgi:hypothetical protein
MGVKLGLLTLREEQRLRVFENRVLRRILGPKRDEVTGDWRIDQVKKDEMGACSTNAYRILVGRPEVIRPLGRLRRR